MKENASDINCTTFCIFKSNGTHVLYSSGNQLQPHELKQFVNLFHIDITTQPKLHYPEYFKNGFEIANKHFVVIRKTQNLIIATQKHKRETLIIRNLPFGMLLCMIIKRPTRITDTLKIIENICTLIE